MLLAGLLTLEKVEVTNNGIVNAVDVYITEKIRSNIEILCDVIDNGTTDLIDMRKNEN